MLDRGARCGEWTSKEPVKRGAECESNTGWLRGLRSGRFDGGSSGMHDERVSKELFAGEIVFKANSGTVAKRTIGRGGWVEIQEESEAIIG